MHRNSHCYNFCLKIWIRLFGIHSKSQLTITESLMRRMLPLTALSGYCSQSGDNVLILSASTGTDWQTSLSHVYCEFLMCSVNTERIKEIRKTWKLYLCQFVHREWIFRENVYLKCPWWVIPGHASLLSDSQRGSTTFVILRGFGTMLVNLSFWEERY